MALTAEQVNAAFRKYIDPEQLTLVVAGDASKGRKAASVSRRATCR
jgi:predicted Zn-dependent peptidase